MCIRDRRIGFGMGAHCAPLRKKKSSAVPLFQSGHMSVICARLSKGCLLYTSNTPEPWLPWPLLFTGLLVNNMYYWATNQSIIQRTFGAKNLKMQTLF